MLAQFQRHEVGHRLGRVAVDEAVALPRPAVAAGIGEHADEVAFAARMDAAHRARPDGAEERRRRLVGNRLRQRPEDEVEDAPDRLEIGTHGRRVLGREDRAFRHREGQRPERAAVDRHVGEDVL
jgi:hypothetical protein